MAVMNHPSPKLPATFKTHALLSTVPDTHWPEILSAGVDATSAVFAFRMTSALCWFDGHFPNQPVLPGVVQTHWAWLLASAAFDQLGEFSALKKLKYKLPILPDQTVSLQLTHVAARDQVSYRYHNDDVEFATGAIVFGHCAI
jgi:3-hydroxymyristoyl/3-hydroxydecanoyl-(acyl carrier protein) dehydratase